MLTAAVTLFLYGLAIWLGDLNQDEGWYLYAARLVSEGERPYIDFATTQGPVLPFVYSVIQAAVDRWGVMAGRVFTALLGVLSVVLAGWLSARLCRTSEDRTSGGNGVCSTACLLAVALTGINVYQCYFTSIVKTYALTACLLLAGFLFLSYALSRWGSLAAFLAGVVLALAAGTRTSAGVALPVAAFMLIWLRSRTFPEAARRAFVGSRHPSAWFVMGGAAGLVFVFLPFVLSAPDGLWFALVQYHGGRDAGGLLKLLAFKAGFFARVTHAYFSSIVLLFFAVGYCVADRRSPTERAPAVRGCAWLSSIVWVTVALVTVLHVMAPFPYDDYQVIVYPIFCAALAALFVRVCDRWLPSLETVVVLLCCFYAAASPVLQGWVVGERDRIWWPLKTEFPLARLQRVARNMNRLGVARGDVLLTQDPYLAVETGTVLPHGLELGPFSYFPDWPTADCRRLNIVNRDLLLGLLQESRAKVAAFSGYGLSIRCPDVTPLPEDEQAVLWQRVMADYRLVDTVPDFGQADTDLRILVRREPTP